MCCSSSIGSFSWCRAVSTHFSDEPQETVSAHADSLAGGVLATAEVVNSGFVRHQQKIISDNRRPPGSKYSEFSESEETD